MFGIYLEIILTTSVLSLDNFNSAEFPLQDLNRLFKVIVILATLSRWDDEKRGEELQN